MGDEEWDDFFGGEIGELNVGAVGDGLNLSDELHLSQVVDDDVLGVERGTSNDWGNDFDLSEGGLHLDEGGGGAFDGGMEMGGQGGGGGGGEKSRGGDANCWDEDFADLDLSVAFPGGEGSGVSKSGGGDDNWDDDFGDLHLSSFLGGGTGGEKQDDVSQTSSSSSPFSLPPPAPAPKPHTLSEQHRIFKQKALPKRPLPKPSPLWSIHPFHSSESTGEGWEKAITHHRSPDDLMDWFSSLSYKVSSFLPDWKVNPDVPPSLSLLHRSVAHLRRLEKSFPTSFHKWMFQSLKFCCHLHWSEALGSGSEGPSGAASSGSAPVSPGGFRAKGSHGVLRQELLHFFKILDKNSHLGRMSAEFTSIVCHQMLSISLSVFLSSSPSSRSPVASPLIPTRLPPSAISYETEQERHLGQICDTFCNMDEVVVSEGWKVVLLFHRGKIDPQTARERLVEAFRLCILPCSTNRHLHSLFLRLMVEKQRKAPPSSATIEALRGEMSEEKLTEMSQLLLCLYLTLRSVSFINLQDIEVKMKSGAGSDDGSDDEEGLTSSFTDFSFYGDEDDSEEEDEAFSTSGPVASPPPRPPRRFPKTPLVRDKSFSRHLPVAEEILRLLEKGGIAAEEMCIALLFSLYPLVSLTSSLKPRIAFTLGCYAKRTINFRLAEKLLFEALFLINSLPSICGVPLLASDLGMQALTAYSEILFQLDKVFIFFIF